MQDATRLVGRRFRQQGDAIVLLGEGRGELGGSEYLKSIHGLVRGTPPALDLDLERRLQTLVAALVADAVVCSAHDCADGGVAVTVAECTFGTGTGADVDIPRVEVSSRPVINDVAALFGESASRVVVSTDPGRTADVLARAAAAGVPARVVGRTGGDRLSMAVGGRHVIDVPVARAEEVWATAIGGYFDRRVA